MRQNYTTAQKTAAMTLLERNGGNMHLTAQQTGIPYGTLYDWRRDMQPVLEQYAPASASAGVKVETPTFASDLDALAFIRQNILGELSRLSASLQHDSGFSTPYQRALVLSQLMDRLLKLDGHLKPYTQPEDEIEEVILMYEGELIDEDEGLTEDDDGWYNHNHDDDDDDNPPA